MKITSIAVVFLASLAPASGFTSYLDQMTGGGAATKMKPASFAPSSGKPQAPAGGGTGSYLDNIAGSATTVAPPPPPPPAAAAPEMTVTLAPPPPVTEESSSSAVVAGADYLSSLKVETAVTGSGLPGYLDVLKSTSSDAGSPTGSGPAGYLDALKGGAAAPPSGAGLAGYLEAIGGGAGSAPKPASFAPSGSKPAATAAPAADGNNAVLEAIGNMNSNMNKNQMATIEVLKDISVGVKSLVQKAEARAAAKSGATAGPWQ